MSSIKKRCHRLGPFASNSVEYSVDVLIWIIGFIPKVKYQVPHYRSGEDAGEELGQQRSQIRIDRSTFFFTHEFLKDKNILNSKRFDYGFDMKEDSFFGL